METKKIGLSLLAGYMMWDDPPSSQVVGDIQW